MRLTHIQDKGLAPCHQLHTQGSADGMIHYAILWYTILSYTILYYTML